MAVTIKLNKKVGRLDIIKTVASHDWVIRNTIQDDTRMVHNQIDKADIAAYMIEAIVDDDNILIIYQPALNELTLISRKEETENKVKHKLAHIVETGRKGFILDRDPEKYIYNIYAHEMFLTDKEVVSLVDEAKQSLINTLSYIS
jgi:hypothetical protein